MILRNLLEELGRGNLAIRDVLEQEMSEAFHDFGFLNALLQSELEFDFPLLVCDLLEEQYLTYFW